ncbi:MAG: hypothetical protein LUG12_12890 [Erysipelotrichaceae bacterium]|nr:hypothetical protein [Erysipelotrichaceae bacterium]
MGKNKLKRKPKKEIRKEKKRNKKIKTTLDWMDIQLINANGITLQKGNKIKITRGIKVQPINIYLEIEVDRIKRCYALANAYDKLKFPLYLQFIRTIPDVDEYLEYYQSLSTKERNPAIQNLMQMQLDKLYWFSDTFKEVIFYIMIQEDEETIDKKFTMLVNEFLQAGFNLTEMTVTDYETIVCNEFENDTVNEYLYTQLLLPQNIESELKLSV